MIEAELFDGTILEFPEGTAPEVIQRKVKELTMQRQRPQSRAGMSPDTLAREEFANQQALQNMEPSFLDIIVSGASNTASEVGRIGGIAMEGLGQGVANMAGAPADLYDASPMLLNLLPGEQGMAPLSVMRNDPNATGFQTGLTEAMDNNPFGFGLAPQRDVDGASVPAAGGTSIQDLFGGAVEGGLNAVGLEYPDLEPQNMGERFLSRIAQEIGASALPLAALFRGGRAAVSGAQGAARTLAQRAKSKVAGNEIGLAATAGTGAQASNEMFTPDGEGTMWTDLAGSLIGSAGVPTVGALSAPLRNLVANAVNPRYATETAKQEITNAIMNASDTVAAQPAPDASPLIDALRTPSPLETSVPGYRAGIGERTGDRGLQVFEDDMNRIAAGPQSRRAQENTRAVNAAVDARAPQGDPGRFRLDLERGVEASINDVTQAAEDAQAAYMAALRDVQPRMESAASRGAAIRQELAAKRDAMLKEVEGMYEQIRASGAPVDLAALRQRAMALEDRFRAEEMNTIERFRPEEMDTLAKLAPDEAMEAGPVVGPVSQVLDLQSGMRATNRQPGTPAPQRRVNQAFDDEFETYLRENLGTDMTGQLDQARIMRSDIGRRFEEPDAIGRALAETGRGDVGIGDGRGMRTPDEAIPGSFIPVADRRITDYRRLKEEVGSNARVQEALRDQIVADAQRAGALESPTALRAFMDDRNIIMADFPELRGQLERAGASKATLDSAQANEASLTRSLAPGGKSAPGQYLRYDPADPVGSINNLVSVGDSGTIRQRARELIETAGTGDQAAADLRRGLWEWLDNSRPGSGQGRLRTTDQGDARWNPAKMVERMRDPKVRALAEELYPGDMIRDWDALEEIFTGLEAATPGRTRAPGSSGTAQAMIRSVENQRGSAGTPRKFSADFRSVQQGRQSFMSAAIQWVNDTLRNVSVQQQRRSIDRLMATVSNDPGLLANILEDYNPAEAAASRNVLTQKYGIRATQVLAIIEGEQEQPEDETTSAIMGGQ